MSCSSCTNNGNSLGCPCQEVQQETYSNGRTVLRDQCTGETKQLLPQITQQQRNTQYDVVVVKATPKAKSTCAGPRQPCQEKKCCKQARKPVCYSCPPKRADPYPADPKCYALLYHDKFDEFKIGMEEDDEWSFYTNLDGFTADDGSHRVTKDGLVLTAQKFTKVYRGKHSDDIQKENEVLYHTGDEQDSNGFLDHFKTFVIRNSDYEVPQCGELYAEACMAARTFGTENHPFGSAVLNHLSDLRLAYATFSMIDFDTGLHIAHVVTNDSLYALYERLPLEGEDGTDEDLGNASFAFAHFIGRRDFKSPLKDFQRLGLAVDRRKGAKWYVDGVLMHTVARLGHLHDPAEALYQLGGQPSTIALKCMHVAFGLFSMLDAVSPSNHRDLEAAGTGLVRLTDFKYQHPWDSEQQVNFVYEDAQKYDRKDGAVEYDFRLFKQGAALKVNELKVEHRA